MNKVILTGRLTRDPESRMTQSYLDISRFSLACLCVFVSRDGERSAQTINRYCRKGQMILVQGKIRNNSYDAQDGTKRYTTDVVVDIFEFFGSKNENGGASYSAPASNNSVAYSPEAPASNIETTDISEDPYIDFGDELTLSSDDLPF